MNIVFRKYLKLKYTWLFHIFGTVFNDKDIKQELKEAISLGNTSLMLKYLAVNDLDLESAITISDWIDNSGLYDKMLMLQTAFNTKTSSGADGKAGRKAKDPDQVENDATAASQDSGMNTADMKSFVAESILEDENFHSVLEEIVENMGA